MSAGALAGRNLHIQIRRLCVYFSYPGRVGELLAQCCERFGGMLHIDSRMMMQFVEEQTACIGDKTWEQLLPGVFGGSWQAVRVLGGFLTGAFVTGIAAILLAGDYDKLREMGQRWSFYENVSEALRGISRAIGRYLHAQCIIMGLVMLTAPLESGARERQKARCWPESAPVFWTRCRSSARGRCLCHGF